ncbi:cytidine deaminase [Paraburkholderia sp. DHOC27]|uniref:cytidine deaminase n=1 Tax=Paraburkholderia sp. DHOC27 TaxID=2303330 RepID=UPI000E3CB4B0|nr:cytidine deaminase [Paraburkholderia sp. DHOC27]RFU48926.1 cytidine deaminase [Paraburkholderia sp. DHOC27]
MQHEPLIQAAREARERAYAPYSRFHVGAALETQDGKVFYGCNVENASYGLCNCAERTAFFSALAAGYKPGQFKTLAVIGQTDGPIAPCGACRQVMIELGTPALEVVLSNLNGDVEVTSAAALLPGAFYLEPGNGAPV